MALFLYLELQLLWAPFQTSAFCFKGINKRIALESIKIVRFHVAQPELPGEEVVTPPAPGPEVKSCFENIILGEFPR